MTRDATTCFMAPDSRQYGLCSAKELPDESAVDHVGFRSVHQGLHFSLAFHSGQAGL